VRTVDYLNYTLFPKGNLNAASASCARDGFLIRVTFQDQRVGYADCAPWTQWGDLSWDQQLKCLATRKITPLLQASLHCARWDAWARGLNQSLFRFPIPPSHALVTSLKKINRSFCEKLSAEGFRHIKCKVGFHPQEEVKLLLEKEELLRTFDFKVRLDFNASLSPEAFEAFLKTLGPFKSKIDFIEDPMPYDSFMWKYLQKKNNIRLALDQASGSPDRGFGVFVLKPEIQEVSQWVSWCKKRSIPLVVTHRMGHPLGRAYAAWIASEIAQDSDVILETCGLLGEGIYEPCEFDRGLSSVGNRLLAPSGLGLGWEQDLNQLRWKPCSS